MSIIIAVCGLAGALVLSFAIPPHHLFSTQRTAQKPADEPIITGSDETP